MLVVIGILLLIAAITLGAINLSISGDRVRSGARQVQSYLEGARSRAVYGGSATAKGADYQCGVRFIRESENPTDPRYYFVTSMQYVEIDPANASISGLPYTYAFWREGTEIRRLVSQNNTVTLWYQKAQQGLIYTGQTIVINSRKYQIDTSLLTPANDILRLLIALPDSTIQALPGYSTTPDAEALPAANNSLEFKLLLAPQPMANQDPRSLGNGAVIDLRSPAFGALLMSKGLDYFLNNNQRIDIMFSPRGTVVGPLSGTGVVEFVVGDRADSLLSAPLSSSFWQAGTNYRLGEAVAPTAGRTAFIYQVSAPAGGGASGSTEPTWPTTAGATVTDGAVTWTCLKSPDGSSSATRDRVIVSLAPQTGMTAVHPVYVPQVLENADPYRYAETGEVARQ
jgi:type II secretory pathway pseudopilin PulG